MSWECSKCGYANNDDTTTVCSCGAARNLLANNTPPTSKLRNFTATYLGGFIFGSLLAVITITLYFSGQTPTAFYEAPKLILAIIIFSSGIVGAAIGPKASEVVAEILRYI